VSSLKSIVVVVLLGTLSVGVYWKMNGGPEPEPPEGIADSWGTPPTIEMSGVASTDPASHLATEVPATGVPPVGGVAAWPPDAAANLPPTAGTPPPWGDPPTGLGTAAPPWRGSANGLSSAAAPATENMPPTPYTSPGGMAATVPATPTGPPLNAPVASGPGAPLGQVPAAGADPAATPTAILAAKQATYREARTAAQQALDRGALSEALLLLSPWYSDLSLPPADRQELDLLLSNLAGTVIYSTDYHMEPPYVVQAGETLQTIANKYQIPDELLARINGIDAAAPLQPGQQLKVVRGPFAASISLHDHTLTLHVGGYYAGRFEVGIGSERQNVEGTWLVKHKLINPTYYGRDRVIDADDPSNPLGEYWIGLANATTQATVEPFGIHGTYDLESIHRDDPRGYIRLKPDDARDMYDILSIGSKVVVLR
jgi:hypothetical protein